MTEFARKFALIAAAVLVPTGIALGALAISSDTGAPPVRVEDATVQMHTPTGEERRSSSSSTSSTTSTLTTSTTAPSPSPAPEPAPAPAPPAPVHPVQPVVPYYGDDWDDDWDDDAWGDDDWDDDDVDDDWDD